MKEEEIKNLVEQVKNLIPVLQNFVDKNSGKDKNRREPINLDNLEKHLKDKFGYAKKLDHNSMSILSLCKTDNGEVLAFHVNADENLFGVFKRDKAENRYFIHNTQIEENDMYKCLESKATFWCMYDGTVFKKGLPEELSNYIYITIDRDGNYLSTIDTVVNIFIRDIKDKHKHFTLSKDYKKISLELQITDEKLELEEVFTDADRLVIIKK